MGIHQEYVIGAVRRLNKIFINHKIARLLVSNKLEVPEYMN